MIEMVNDKRSGEKRERWTEKKRRQEELFNKSKLRNLLRNLLFVLVSHTIYLSDVLTSLTQEERIEAI